MNTDEKLVFGLTVGEIAGLPHDSDFGNPTDSAKQLIDVLTLMASRDQKSADEIANNFLKEIVSCVTFKCPVCKTRRPVQKSAMIKALYNGFIGEQVVCIDCKLKSGA